MPLQLESLVFDVNTDKLKLAKDSIDALAASMQNLNKVQQDEAKSAIAAEKVKQQEAKTAKEVANAKTDEAKAEEVLTKAKKGTAAATEESNQKQSAAEKIQGRVAAKVELLRSGIVSLGNETINLGKGFTTSQASMLANLKVMEATSDIIKNVANDFRNLNAISSAKPFDPTVAGLEKLRKEAQELTMVNEYMAKGFGLTKDQIMGLSRDIESLRQQYNLAGKSTEDLNTAITKTEKETVQAAQALNALIASSDLATKQAKEHAQAEANRAAMIQESSDNIRKNYLLASKEAESAYKQDMQIMNSYYTDMATKADAASNQRLNSEKEAWNNTKLLWDARRNHEESMYADSMSDMRTYYSAMEREANEAARELAKIQDRINKEIYQSNYMNDGASRSTANVAAGMQVRGVPQDVINSFVQEANAKELSAKATRERTAAINALEKAEQSALSVMQSLGGITAGAAAANKEAAIAVANYERNLRLAGITGETAAKKLALFRTQQNAIAMEAEKRQSAYLTRALLPQFSDIFVGLTTGMNPMTVMLQQLPQINDLITLTGRNAKDTVGILTTAAKEMITRLQGTAASVGIAIGQAIMGIGKNITTGLIAPFTLAISTFKAAKDYLTQGDIIPVDFGPNIDKKTLAVNNLRAAWVAFAATTKAVLVSLGGFAALLGGAYLISLIKVEKENNALVRAINLTGAALGMSADKVKSSAKEFESFGISATSAIATITEMAKQGLSGTLVDTVVTTADVMKKVFGQSVEDTVKKFKEFEKDPVAALIKTAEETGNVNTETIRVINSLVEDRVQVRGYWCRKCLCW
jgi:hypothetical protein